MRRRLSGWLAVFTIVGLLGACSSGGGGEGGGSGGAGAPEPGTADAGRQVVAANNCTLCHSLDGSSRTGPTFAGAWGSEVPLADGTSVTFDRAYLEESIAQPGAKVHEGFSPVMRAYDLSTEELNGLEALLRSLR